MRAKVKMCPQTQDTAPSHSHNRKEKLLLDKLTIYVERCQHLQFAISVSTSPLKYTIECES